MCVVIDRDHSFSYREKWRRSMSTYLLRVHYYINNSKWKGRYLGRTWQTKFIIKSNYWILILLWSVSRDHMHRCTDAQMYRWTGAQMHRCKCVQMHMCADAQVHNCTCAQLHMCRSVLKCNCAHLHRCRHVDM